MGKREEFEEWARGRDLDLSYRNYPGQGHFYTCARTLLAYEAWQASRAAAVIELPFLYDGPLQKVTEAIEAAGLKVAP